MSQKLRRYGACIRRASHPYCGGSGLSVFVTTYQAGKLVIVRADGDHLNTHFRLPQPDGPGAGGRSAGPGYAPPGLGIPQRPGVAAEVPPAGSHDACFLPRSCHVTGDVRIHEMAWAGDELWFVNTRFSCLCTLDRYHSFVPRWRPPFVTALTPEDRCHLNGLGVVDGRPRYVTALGATDSAAGWRADKARGGVLIDVPSGEMIATAAVDAAFAPLVRRETLAAGVGHGHIRRRGPGLGPVRTDRRATRLHPWTRLPRRFAFIGLSQVRETAVFSGIPITESLRPSGPAASGSSTSIPGRTVAFLRFEDAVQEIFAVQVVPGRRYPDLINDDPTLLDDSFVLTDEALSTVPEPLRTPA